MNYYTNNRVFKIDKKIDGKYEVTAYNQYIGETSDIFEAFSLCEANKEIDIPLDQEKLF